MSEIQRFLYALFLPKDKIDAVLKKDLKTILDYVVKDSWKDIDQKVKQNKAAFQSRMEQIESYQNTHNVFDQQKFDGWKSDIANNPINWFDKIDTTYSKGQKIDRDYLLYEGSLKEAEQLKTVVDSFDKDPDSWSQFIDKISKTQKFIDMKNKTPAAKAMSNKEYMNKVKNTFKDLVGKLSKPTSVINSGKYAKEEILGYLKDPIDQYNRSKDVFNLLISPLQTAGNYAYKYQKYKQKYLNLKYKSRNLLN